ncbi:MAG: hypothetical protein HYU68_09450 [Bacteroidetes bacterium]|nr:hypothetical protein [Bacteroidota bacterium]
MNNKKHDEDFFRTVYGDEELEKLKKLELSKQKENFSLDEGLNDDIYPIKNNLKQREMKKIEDLFNEFEAEKDMTKKFAEIADKLMNNFVIRANRKDFRLAEIEFYLHEKEKHEDDFIHSKIIKDKPNDSAKHQIKMGCWYFHYSGIDLTFGDKNNNRFGGILIRSIIPLEDEIKPIIGPLKLKNHLLNQYENISQSRDFLKLIPIEDKLKQDEIIPMQRVGLGTTGDEDFRNLKYRFVLAQIKDKVKLK